MEKKKSDLFFILPAMLLHLVCIVFFFLKIPGAVDFRGGFLEIYSSKILLYSYLALLLVFTGLCLRPLLQKGRAKGLSGRLLFFAGLINFMFSFFVIVKPTGTEVYWYIIARAMLALLGGWMVFFLYPRLSIRDSRLLKILAIGLCALFALLPASQILPNKMYYTPVVYAVGDTYQIVWRTGAKSAAWVDIGGARYYDSVGGAVRSDEKIHKVSVPMTALDEARSYTVSSQKILHRGAYFALKGREISAAYSFRPVDVSDGLQVYHLADVHSKNAAPIEAAGYWGDRLDLLILNGDIANDVPQEHDVMHIIELASGITKGEIPVIYARGNHETRGAWTEPFGRYVGSVNGDEYYFTARLGNVWFLILDLGEDKDDGHPEYSGLADYGPYRERQAAFVERVAAEKEYEASGIDYRVLVSHIRVTNKKAAYGDLNARWTEAANEMGIDLHLCGHSHMTVILEADAEGTDGECAHNFPIVIGSRRVEGGFIGTAAQLGPEGIDIFFTDSLRQIVN